MRNSYKLLALLLSTVVISSGFAQKRNDEGLPKTPKLWKLSEIQFKIGGYEDHYHDLSIQGLQSMIGDQDELSNYLSEDAQESYVTAITGANVGFLISFNPFNRSSEEYNTNHEWRVGVSSNSNREAMLVYDVETNYPGYGPSSNEVIFCLIENELVLETSYLFNWHISDHFTLYGGAGASWGATHNNEVLIFGSGVQNNPLVEDATHEALRSNYVRIVGQGGMKYRMISGFGMFLEVQGGSGWQIVHGGDNNTLENCATSFGFYYDFGD